MNGRQTGNFLYRRELRARLFQSGLSQAFIRAYQSWSTFYNCSGTSKSKWLNPYPGQVLFIAQCWIVIKSTDCHCYFIHYYSALQLGSNQRAEALNEANPITFNSTWVKGTEWGLRTAYDKQHEMLTGRGRLCVKKKKKKQGSRGNQSKQGSQGKEQWPHGQWYHLSRLLSKSWCTVLIHELGFFASDNLCIT